MDTTDNKSLNRYRNKKIWIDLDNSPHVLFFNPIIKEVNKRGCRVIVTIRDYAQVCGLADLFNIKYTQIGRHYGKRKILKVMGTAIRGFQMIPFVISRKPDLLFSHGSRAPLIAAKLTGLPNIMAFDYEHAQGLPFFKPTLALVPEVLPEDVIKKSAKFISKYPGIKEDVYIHNLSPDSSILKSLGIKDGDLVVTIRPPASSAHYHVSDSDELFRAVIDYLSNKAKTRLIILPRTKEQSVVIKNKWSEFVDSSKIIIPEQVINGLNLIWHSDLVISGGGTMIREAAALKVPCYSIFGGKTGAVDKFLKNSGRLVLIQRIEDVENKILLTRRQRPYILENKSTETLKIIVDHVISML